MTKLPHIKGQELVAVLCRAGFEVIRIKGSHHCSPFMTLLPLRPAFVHLLGQAMWGSAGMGRVLEPGVPVATAPDVVYLTLLAGSDLQLNVIKLREKVSPL